MEYAFGGGGPEGEGPAGPGADLQHLAVATEPSPLPGFAGRLFGPRGEVLFNEQEGNQRDLQFAYCFICEATVMEPNSYYLRRFAQIAREMAGRIDPFEMFRVMADYYAGTVQQHSGRECPWEVFYNHFHQHAPDDLVTNQTNLLAVRGMTDRIYGLGLPRADNGVPQMPTKETVDSLTKLIRLEQLLHDRRHLLLSRKRVNN